MTLLEHRQDNAPHIPRPAYRQPLLILLVLVGGGLGTAGREGLSLAMPSEGGIPWAVLIVNLVGAFLLGYLLTWLAGRGPETRVIRDIRLFVGTGFMGGFTTYSSLATDSASLMETSASLGVAYAVGSVVAGLGAAALGVWIGVRPDASAGAGGPQKGVAS